MGLMAEVPWGLSSSTASTTDFHLDNIKNIRRLSAKGRQLKNQAESSRPRPVRAFALPEHQDQKKQFATVQPRLYDWTMDGSGPDPPGLPLTNGRPNSGRGRKSPTHQSREALDGDSKRFLLGHEKTGPFVPSSAASVVSGYRKSRTLERSPRDIYDGVHSEIQSAMKSNSSRFSEVSVEERKLRIQMLVNDIYSVEPLCKQNLTRQTIEKNLRRYVSSDQVSDVGSIRAGSVRSRPDHKVASRVGRAASSNRINVNNVEPLTRSQLQKHNLNYPQHSERDYSNKRESPISPTLRQTDLR
jgi:hypothetical protein